MYVVRKALYTEGLVLNTGEVVDASLWRNCEKLEALRFIKRFYGEPVACELCERKFEDAEALALHVAAEHPAPPEPELEDTELLDVEKTEASAVPRRVIIKK